MIRKVQYALIGFGGIAENRIAREGFALDRDRFKPLTRAVLKGATDVNPRRRRAAESLGLAWYADAAAVLADDDIDAVFIATNNRTHAELALRALEAGKAVMVEKPIAPNSRDARRVVEAARRRGLSLSVDHMMKHNALNRKARQWVAEGVLGEVNDAVFHMQFAFGYEPSEAASWRCSDADEMGGPIGDVASHCFYLAEFILGSEIQTLRAVYYPKRMAIQVEDGALVQCDLRNGMTVTLQVSFCDPRGGPVGTLSNLGYEIYGSRGVARGYGTMFQLSGHAGEPYPIRLEADYGSRRRVVRPGRQCNIYQGAVDEHARSVLAGRPLDAADGLRNVLLCEAAHRSARKQGAAVNVV